MTRNTPKASIAIRSAAMQWAYHSDDITRAAAELAPLVKEFGVEPFAREAGVSLGAWLARPWPHYVGEVFTGALLLRACPVMDHELLARYVNVGHTAALEPRHTAPYR